MCLYLAFGGILGFLPAIILGMLIGGRGDGLFFERFLQSLPYAFGVWVVLSVVGAGLINLWLQRKAAPYMQLLRDREKSMRETNAQAESKDAETPPPDEK